MAKQRQSFGQVVQRGSRFRARYRRDGQVYYGPRSFATKQEARDWLARIQSQLSDGSWRPPVLDRASLDDHLTQWLRENGRLRDSTRATYAADIRLHISPYLGHVRLADLTTAMVRTWFTRLRDDLAAEHANRLATAQARYEQRQAAWMKHRRGQPPAPPRLTTGTGGAATAARCYRHLRAALNVAVSNGQIRQNPCVDPWMADPAKFSAETVERPTLSVTEVATLAEAVGQRYRALVLLLAWCGLRIGEACALTRADVDLDADPARVTVRRRVYEVGGQWSFADPKSKAGRRRVTLPAVVSDALGAHLAEFTDPDATALVFTSRTGNVARAAAPQAITKALDAMGRSDVRVHDLRHTGQQLAALAGASQAELMRRMGHDSPQASLAYQHAADEESAAIAARLNQAARAGSNVTTLPARTASGT